MPKTGTLAEELRPRLAFAFAFKIALIQLYFTTQKFILMIVRRKNAVTNKTKRLKRCRVALFLFEPRLEKPEPQAQIIIFY